MSAKERPIIFNDEMVRAILDGRKTQTRRIVKLPVIDKDIGCELSGSELAGSQRDALRHCPHGQPGDRLWVRETFWEGLNFYRDIDCELKSAWNGNVLGFEVDGFSPKGKQCGKRPSIHMPRWASRITLKITGVRVDRLQEISEADAMAEGIEPDGDFFGAQSFRSYSADKTPCDAFCSYESLWESIYGHGSWNANPWVWVIEFKQLQNNTNRNTK